MEGTRGYGKALLVGGALLALTTLSYGLSRLHLGTWGLGVALAIAVTKASLVAFFYMHLSERSGGPRLVIATAAVFVVILIGLILVEASDRPSAAMPPGPFPIERLPGLDGQPGGAPPREPPSEQAP
jgi:cytochrome c oxidase subunit 4